MTLFMRLVCKIFVERTRLTLIGVVCLLRLKISLISSFF